MHVPFQFFSAGFGAWTFCGGRESAFLLVHESSNAMFAAMGQPPSNPVHPPPKVSVLVPSRNHARFLPETLSSVLEQGFNDYEVIISDDASEDESAAIARQFAGKDARIRVTVHSPRLGLVENFNWCLSQARGQYVKFLLSDDKLARADALERLVRMMERDPGVVLASCATQIINEASELTFVRDYLRSDRIEEGSAACRRCLTEGVNQIGEPSVFLFRRSSAPEGFNPAYRFWVDLELALRVMERGRFAYSTEPLVAFRRHAAQQTHLLVEQHLLPIEYYGLLVQFADRPWLGRARARERLFEALYQSRKSGSFPAPVLDALNRALHQLGRDGYGSFLVRRKFFQPFKKLRHSLAKRLWKPSRADASRQIQLSIL
jgi:glycosyltransferase involved in cell wall biosynthesis